MEELEKGLEVALGGRLAADLARRARERITRWGLSMPDVEPLVFDFGLGDFERVGEIEFWIANEVEAGYCGKFLFVFDGQRCPVHFHKLKLETFYLVKGALSVKYGNETVELAEGDVLRVETCVRHGFVGIGPALLLEVSRPSIIEDNYFDDPSIPIGGNYAPRRETGS